MKRYLAVWLVLGVLAGCSAPPTAAPPTAAPPTAAPPTAAPPTAAPPAASGPEIVARRVALDGRELVLICAGSGSPTVLFESGLGADARTWGSILPAVAQKTRACAYDRAGIGLSDPDPRSPRSSALVAEDLFALLNTAGEAGPFILVAHSFGGLHARVFRAAHPELVVGMVLIESVYEGWWPEATALLPADQAADDERLQAFRRFLSEDVADPSRNPEGLDILASAEQAAASGDLGDLPLLVISGGRFDIIAPGLPRELDTELRRLWLVEFPQRLAALSSDSSVVIANSGHNVPAEDPQVILVAIDAILASLTNQ